MAKLKPTVEVNRDKILAALNELLKEEKDLLENWMHQFKARVSEPDYSAIICDEDGYTSTLGMLNGLLLKAGIIGKPIITGFEESKEDEILWFI